MSYSMRFYTSEVICAKIKCLHTNVNDTGVESHILYSLPLDSTSWVEPLSNMYV